MIRLRQLLTLLSFSARNLRAGRQLTLFALALGLLLTLPVGASAATGSPARSSESTVVSPTRCGGDVCFVTLPAPGTVTSGDWAVAANGSSFHGRFRIEGPNIKQYSPVRTWKAHGLNIDGAGWFTKIVHLDHGIYCVRAYRNGVSIGRACLREPVTL